MTTTATHKRARIISIAHGLSTATIVERIGCSGELVRNTLDAAGFTSSGHRGAQTWSRPTQTRER